MSKTLKKYKFLLENYGQLPADVKSKLLTAVPDDLLKCLVEICTNIQKKNVPINRTQKSKLSRYKRAFKNFTNHSVSKARKRNILKKIGSGFLPIILSIVGPILNSLLK